VFSSHHGTWAKLREIDCGTVDCGGSSRYELLPNFCDGNGDPSDSFLVQVDIIYNEVLSSDQPHSELTGLISRHFILLYSEF
jgi:hypothetical protein